MSSVPSPPSLPSARLEALAEAIDATFDEQVAWLERLVNQPSHTFARDDVEAAMSLLDEEAAHLGMSRQRVDPEDPRLAHHRVYATPATATTDATIALVGHVDTVFPRSDGFLTFSREGDLGRGPGIVDMKGGLCVGFFALRAVQAILGSGLGGIGARMLCVSDEEVGSPSSRVLFRTIAPRTTAALVLEAGRDEDRIITQRKGGGVFHLHVTGRPAHAGNAHAEGVNAIHALALIIPRIEAITDYARGMTVSVGLIKGGTAKNTIPEHAHCTIDARFIRGEDADACVAALEAIAADPFGGLETVTPPRLREVHCRLEGGVTRPPLEASPANQALRQAYERHALAAGLKIGEAPRCGGGSDANLLAASGVPCIDGLGPYGKGYHTHDEWCSLSSLKQRTLALASFLAGLQPSHDGE